MKKFFDFGVGVTFFQRAINFWFTISNVKYNLSFGRGVPNGGLQSIAFITCIKEWIDETGAVEYARMIFTAFEKDYRPRRISNLKRWWLERGYEK